MPKFISFPKHPTFSPMYNPKEMLEMGVNGGTSFKYLGDPKLIWARMPWDTSKWGQTYSPENNFYKVDPINDYYNIAPEGNYWTPGNFFEWYTEFYFGHLKEERDKDLDYFYMSRWAHYLVHVAEKFKAQILRAEPRIAQTLLELGIDVNEIFKQDITWMRDKFPLKLYPPATSLQ